MTENKTTKRENYQTLLVILAAVEADESLSDFVQHEIDLLDRKRGNKGSNSKAVAEANATAEKILAVLAEADEPMKATPIADAADMTVQKASASLRKLVAEGVVTRTEDKKVATFSLAE